jgi:hypothetical protein
MVKCGRRSLYGRVMTLVLSVLDGALLLTSTFVGEGVMPDLVKTRLLLGLMGRLFTTRREHRAGRQNTRMQGGLSTDVNRSGFDRDRYRQLSMQNGDSVVTLIFRPHLSL